jgi:hypothetical protein
MQEMARRLDVPATPAAWPLGISHLAQALDACQRCDTGVVCADWLKRAPAALAAAPAFCPNKTVFDRAKNAAGAKHAIG